MYQYSSHMYGTQWESHMSFDPLSQIQTQAGFCASAAKIEPHNQLHQNNNIEVFPANWSIDDFPKTTTESTSVMFPSVAESLLSSSAESHSSSERYGEFPSSYSSDENHSNIILHEPASLMAFCEQFPQEHDKLLRDNDDSTDLKPLGIPFQRNQILSFTKVEKQCPVPYGVTTSSNSASRRAPSAGKRRIRWTKDLHESFMIIVNRLGGPDKAKPKAILEMMKTDLLSISHVKSHLQKCRTSIFQHKALHEGSDEEEHKTDDVNELQMKIHMQIEESRQLQLEVKRSIHKQLEMQRHLQVLIERQREHLKMLYDQQKERTKLENI